MNQPISYGRALYYPYINFQREHWVKMAALFYEGIDRIVPDSLRESESELVKRLNEDDEFVRNVDPGEAADSIAVDFLEFAERELLRPEQRRRILKGVELKVRKNEPYRIHSHKLNYILCDALPQMGLANRSSSHARDDWYEFEPVTGAVYMTVLANRLASARRIPVVTDTALFQPLINSVQLDDRPSGEDVSLALATIVVESVVPQGLDSISMRTILRFRREHRDEMRQYYMAINDLVKDLRGINNQDMNPAWIAVGLTAAMGTTIGEEGIKARTARAASPYSYVLSLRRHLRPDSFAKSMVESRILI